MRKLRSIRYRNVSTDPLEAGCGSQTIRGAHFGNRWYLTPNLWGNWSTVLITLSLLFLTDEFWGSVSGVAETPLLCMWRCSRVAETSLLCVMWRCLPGQSVFWRFDENYCVHLQDNRVSRTVRTIEHWRWRHLFLSKRLQLIAQRRNVMFYKKWIHFLTGYILLWVTFWHILVCRVFSRVANVCWLRNFRVAGKGGRTEEENTSN